MTLGEAIEELVRQYDKACCLIGEKVDNIGWRWYEVDIDTFRPLKEGEEPNDK